jgi:branched-chain amino acid transport system substrate-binding protein
VPFPEDKSVPLVARYHEALKAANPNSEPGFVSLEGYMAGRLVVAALEKISGEPSRQALLSAIMGGSFDLGGVTLKYGPDDNQGMDEVFLTVIQPDGKFKPITALNQAGG